jgi:hypothetical protein
LVALGESEDRVVNNRSVSLPAFGDFDFCHFTEAFLRDLNTPMPMGAHEINHAFENRKCCSPGEGIEPNDMNLSDCDENAT